MSVHASLVPGELLSAVSGPPEGEVFPVRSLGDFGNSSLLDLVSSPQVSTTSTSTFAVIQVAPGDAVKSDSACPMLQFLVGLQWETWIPCWSWVSMTKSELYLYLFIACLLCLHPLLTLCIWNPPLTAVIFEYSVSPSNARVSAASFASMTSSP